ncbi:MAG: methyltransferase, TrmH family [Clostridiales bacterium]|nr:methyltransferase, TrmH family [Clostridiales bacterium]MDN5282188.1 methyltransferase, TrmH family [Candidatus Ozemobacter sp.]
MKIIESRNNPIIKKALKVARDSKGQSGLFIVEGEKLIREALKSGAVAETFFRTRSTRLNIPELADISIEIPPVLFRELSTVTSPSDAICLFRYSRPQNFEEALAGANMLVVIDRLQDPGNLGTIFRTAEAMGVQAIALLKGSCSHLNPKSIRAAMGSAFRLSIFSDLEFHDLKRLLIKYDFSAICADMSGQSLYSFSFPDRTALFFGQEGRGLAEEIKKECTIRLAIPMQGQVESLNVATSASICLYEWAKQQSKI